MKLFDVSFDQYWAMSSIEKCKIEIKVRLKRLEKFAVDSCAPFDAKVKENDFNETFLDLASHASCLLRVQHASGRLTCLQGTQAIGVQTCVSRDWMLCFVPEIVILKGM